MARQGAYLPGSQYILMTLTDMADPGLTVFPTHRLVRGLESFDSAALLAACGEDFTLEAKPSREESQAALDSLFQQGRHAFALYDGKSWTVLALKDTAVMEKLLPEKSQAYRTLDVSILHSLVLEKLLGIDKENMANQKNLTYTRSAEEAQAAVDRGREPVLLPSQPHPGWRRLARWLPTGRRCPRNPPISTPSSSPAWR